MNTEDEVQYEGRTGWHTFQILCDRKNIWMAWKGLRFIAAADTRDKAIEKAKQIVDGKRS